MKDSLQSDRISDAGVDVLQIAETSVLVKVGDIAAEQVRQHPVYALCRALGALGFGAIYLCGAADYFDALDEVMKGTDFQQHLGIWLMPQIASAAPDADVIVDLSNDVARKSFCLRLSSVRSCPGISVIWGRHWVSINGITITASEPREFSTLGAPEEDTIAPISRIASGLALQEVVMATGNVRLAAPLEKIVIYNAAADDRTSCQTNQPWTDNIVENAIVEVVGAGGTGVHFLESVVPVLGDGCELRIFDPDKVGVENIPLQTPYSVDDVDRDKAVIVAEKLHRIRPDLRILPMVMAYQDRPQQLSLPSVRVLCVDNFEARKYANDLSTMIDGVPLAECGSTPLAAQQRTYVKGRTSCLGCRIRNLDKKVADEKQRNSCSANRALTLPGTNMIIAGILATEVLKVLCPEHFGLPSRGTINYDARVPQRFGVLDIQPPCEHQKHVEAENS